MPKFEHMGRQAPKEEQVKRLDEEEAHKEANMLRASMKMDPETGKILKEKPGREYGEPRKWIEKRATAKDYRVAEKALNDLEELAEKDPELLVKLSQYAQSSALGVIAPFVVLDSVLGGPMSHLEKTLEQWRGEKPDQEKPEEGSFAEAVFRLKKMKDQIFSDARSQLERLEEAGEKFGEQESEQEKVETN